MTPPKSDYFVYISTTPERARWGVEVLGSGFAKIALHQPYPAPGHPSDHHFDFKNGRTLQALQILFVAEGSGWLQMESRQRQRISAESVVFLLPGVWHSYRPDPKTGWEEHWVELDGWVVRRLIEEGVINNRQCVFQGVESSGIAELFEKLHALLTGRRQYTVPELANTAHELLGLCAELPSAAKNPSRIAGLVRRAEEAPRRASKRKCGLGGPRKKTRCGVFLFPSHLSRTDRPLPLAVSAALTTRARQTHHDLWRRDPGIYCGDGRVRFRLSPLLRLQKSPRCVTGHLAQTESWTLVKICPSPS